MVVYHTVHFRCIIYFVCQSSLLMSYLLKFHFAPTYQPLTTRIHSLLSATSVTLAMTWEIIALDVSGCLLRDNE